MTARRRGAPVGTAALNAHGIATLALVTTGSGALPVGQHSDRGRRLRVRRSSFGMCCPQIAWLGAQGITRGTDDSGHAVPGFHPAAVVTRQSMAAFLHRFSNVVT